MMDSKIIRFVEKVYNLCYPLNGFEKSGLSHRTAIIHSIEQLKISRERDNEMLIIAVALKLKERNVTDIYNRLHYLLIEADSFLKHDETVQETSKLSDSIEYQNKQQRVKKESDDDSVSHHPRRAISAYLYFASERRPQMKNEFFILVSEN